MDEFDTDFRQTVDPAAWAAAFAQTIADDPARAQDEGFMIGWFANAMCAAETRIRTDANARIEGQNREVRALAYYIAEHCRRHPVHADTEAEAVLPVERAMLSFVREHLIRLDNGEVAASRG